jgi:hypothetical protein
MGGLHLDEESFMAISFSCACGKRLKVSDTLVGKKVKCPQCQAVTLVTANGEAAPAAPSKAVSRPAVPAGKAGTMPGKSAGSSAPPSAKSRPTPPPPVDESDDSFPEEDEAPPPVKKKLKPPVDDDEPDLSDLLSDNNDDEAHAPPKKKSKPADDDDPDLSDLFSDNNDDEEAPPKPMLKKKPAPVDEEESTEMDEEEAPKPALKKKPRPMEEEESTEMDEEEAPKPALKKKPKPMPVDEPEMDEDEAPKPVKKKPVRPISNGDDDEAPPPPKAKKGKKPIDEDESSADDEDEVPTPGKKKTPPTGEKKSKMMLIVLIAVLVVGGGAGALWVFDPLNWFGPAKTSGGGGDKGKGSGKDKGTESTPAKFEEFKGTGFTAKVPDNKKEHKEKGIKNKDLSFVGVQGNSAGVMYKILAADLKPEPMTDEEAEKIIEDRVSDFKQGKINKKDKGKAAEEIKPLKDEAEPFGTNKFPGRYLEFSGARHKVFVVNDKLYQLSAVGQQDKLSSQEVTDFFNEFKLDPEPEKKFGAKKPDETNPDDKKENDKYKSESGRLEKPGMQYQDDLGNRSRTFCTNSTRERGLVAVVSRSRIRLVG